MRAYIIGMYPFPGKDAAKRMIQSVDFCIDYQGRVPAIGQSFEYDGKLLQVIRHEEGGRIVILEVP